MLLPQVPLSFAKQHADVLWHESVSDLALPSQKVFPSVLYTFIFSIISLAKLHLTSG